MRVGNQLIGKKHSGKYQHISLMLNCIIYNTTEGLPSFGGSNWIAFQVFDNLMLANINICNSNF